MEVTVLATATVSSQPEQGGRLQSGVGRRLAAVRFDADQRAVAWQALHAGTGTKAPYKLGLFRLGLKADLTIRPRRLQQLGDTAWHGSSTQLTCIFRSRATWPARPHAAARPVSAPVWARSGSARPVDVRLSPIEMDACFELLGLGETPPTLDLPSPGRTVPKRQDHLDAILLDLQRRGMADRRGPSEQVTELLRVLAHPDHQLDLRMYDEHRGGLTAIAAARRGNGVLTVYEGNQISLAAIRTSALVPTVVGLVGQMCPGRGAAVNVPADAFDTAWQATTDGQLSDLVDQLTEVGIPRADVVSCMHMCRGIRALGQLGTVHYSGRSARLGPWVIGFHRTDAGYYLQLRRPGPYGREVVTICPLNAPRLTQLAAELLDAGPAQPPRRHTW